MFLRCFIRYTREVKLKKLYHVQPTVTRTPLSPLFVRSFFTQIRMTWSPVSCCTDLHRTTKIPLLTFYSSVKRNANKETKEAPWCQLEDLGLHETWSSPSHWRFLRPTYVWDHHNIRIFSWNSLLIMSTIFETGSAGSTWIFSFERFGQKSWRG